MSEIWERKENIIEMYYNPYTMPVDRFDGWHLSSVRDKGRKATSGDLFYQANKTKMNISDLGHKDCYVLYSGGKESFLTCKILEFYGIEYKKIFISELGDIRDSEKGEGYDEISAFHREGCIHIDSTVIHDNVASNRFGRNFPITYWYILHCMERFGDANYLVGAEWLSTNYLHNEMKFEHSDMLYADLNNDPEIYGNVYSVVNCLREYDIYRLVSNYFEYDDRWSTYDHKRKIERISYFREMNKMTQNIIASKDRGDILSALDFIIPEIRLMNPIIYDFRHDVSMFIESLK